jgi:hypothetical protein
MLGVWNSMTNLLSEFGAGRGITRYDISPVHIKTLQNFEFFGKNLHNFWPDTRSYRSKTENLNYRVFIFAMLVYWVFQNRPICQSMFYLYFKEVDGSNLEKTKFLLVEKISVFSGVRTIDIFKKHKLTDRTVLKNPIY